MRRSSRIASAAVALTLALGSIAVFGTASLADTTLAVLRTLTPTPSSNGRAVAFDPGTGHLFYTNAFDPHIYVTDTSGNLLDTLTTHGPDGQPINYGALSWESTSNGGELWGGRFDGSGRVDVIDPHTGLASPITTVSFPPHDSCYNQPDGYIDGLAFDPSDGTLWVSDDASRVLLHLRSDGAPLASYTVPNGLCNSGIAVNAHSLFLATQSGPDTPPYAIVQVAKANPSSGVMQTFSLPDAAGPEGLALDPATFAGQCALWSNQFDTVTLTAHALPLEDCRGVPGAPVRYFVTPDVKVIQYISAIDGPACAAQLAARISISGVRAATACGLLAASANPTPPSVLDDASWPAFVASKEYRGFVHFPRMVVECTGNTVTAVNNQPVPTNVVPTSMHIDGFEWSPGWTPPRPFQGLPFTDYQPGDLFTDDAGGSNRAPLFDRSDPIVSMHPDGTLVISYLSAARMASLERPVAYAITGYDAPYIWTVNQIRFNCAGGRESVSIANSMFPTTNLYIDGQLKQWYTENHLADFIADGQQTFNLDGTGWLALQPTCGSSLSWSLHPNAGLPALPVPGAGCLGLIDGGPNGGASGHYL